jgi:hypothetical protein
MVLMYLNCSSLRIKKLQVYKLHDGLYRLNNGKRIVELNSNTSFSFLKICVLDETGLIFSKHFINFIWLSSLRLPTFHSRSDTGKKERLVSPFIFLIPVHMLRSRSND